MRRGWIRLLTLGAVLGLTPIPALAEREVHPSPGQAPFEFALIGDAPYIASNTPGIAYPPFERLVNEINRDHKIEWLLHAGDIKSGSTVCSDEMFADRLSRFNSVQKPVVYTPGDNEWTDCHRTNNGQYQPLERLAKLRQVFFSTLGQTLGAVPMKVVSQAQRPGYEEFPENVRWTHKGVMFATLHIVGSSNAQAPFQAGSSAVRTPADDDEVVRRNAANLTWLHNTFDLANANGAPGVFIMIQANPGLEFDQSVADRQGYEEFLAALETRTQAYGKPVVLAHGDSHYFRIDKPRLLHQRFVRNFTRVETFGAGNVHWVRVRVDPRSEHVFSFQEEIVEGNP